MLKPGQTVEIHTPDKIGKYFIVECGVPGNIYNRYGTEHNYSYHAVVNDNEIVGVSKGVDIAGNPILDYTTSEAAVTERATVVFTNHVNEDYLRTLSITKELLAEDGITKLSEEDDPTGFRYRLYLGENLNYYNMKDYYVKNPDGEYCFYGVTDPNDETESPHFVSIKKKLFEILTENEKEIVTFTTSPTGSIDKIPAGYTVEIRDLPVGTQFKVEEQTTDLPKGYTRKQYIRDEQYPYTLSQEGVYNEGSISEGYNARMYVVNQRGWGLTVNKEWTDKSFTKSHDPIYVAMYTGSSDDDLIEGSIREIAYPTTSVYYFIEKLDIGKSFSDYSVCEVKLEGAVITDGNVTSYSSIERITEGMPVEIGATDLSGTVVSPTAKYLVTYDSGEARGVTGNVREDIITNQREGGVIIRLYDWVLDWDTELPDKPKMLSGAVFTLEKDGQPVGDGTYTSDSRGLITVLYDFDVNDDYTLTQISSPTGYQGLVEPIIFRIPASKDSITVSADSALNGWYKAETIDQTSGDNLIAYVNVKNREYTLVTKKVDPDPADPKDLPGAHFALYKQYTRENGTLVKDYYPMPGYEDRSSGLNGVVVGIDQTLTAGTYYVTETEAPTNYDKREEDILFTISVLGYVSADPSGYLTENVTQDGTVEYTINIPNKKLVLTPPVLYVSKKVQGNTAQTTKPFRFTVSGLTPNKEYVYQRFETEDGINYTAQSGSASLGLIKVNANGEISFDLMHYEKIGLSLPYGSMDLTVSESAYSGYTTSYELGNNESITGNTVEIESFLEDVVIKYTNSIDDESIVAPTGLSTRNTPFLLLLLFGLMFLIGGGVVAKRRRGDDPDADSTAVCTPTNPGPSGDYLLHVTMTESRKLADTPQPTNSTTDAESYMCWRNSVWVEEPLQHCGYNSTSQRGYVPQVRRNVSCPQAKLWMNGGGEAG